MLTLLFLIACAPDDDILLEGPDLADASADLDEPFAGLQLLDAHGETVDVYDLAGKPTIVAFSAVWCPGCTGIAGWLAGAQSPYGLEEAYPHIRGLVDSGELQWLHVVAEDDAGDCPDLADLQAWDAAYGHPLVPSFAGYDAIVDTYVPAPDDEAPAGPWPAIYLLDAEMRIQAMPEDLGSGKYRALATADELRP